MISEQQFRLKKDGTSRKYCICRTPELIENYDKAIADTTQVWQCHHRLETHNSDGERRLVDLSKEELIALGMYFDRPPEELIFLKSAEHKSLHNVGKVRSEESKKKQSEANKGKKRSEESRKKQSESCKGRTAWNKGKHWNKRKKVTSSGMKGKHHSEETKKKMSEAKRQWKVKHWKLVDGKRAWY